MLAHQPNLPKLRLLAAGLGVVSAFAIARLALGLAGESLAVWPESWLDRLFLLLQPLLGGVGVVAAVGLWRGRRWGAVGFTGWVCGLVLQVALQALAVALLANLMWRPLVASLVLLGGAVFVGYRPVRAVWRWVTPSDLGVSEEPR